MMKRNAIMRITTLIFCVLVIPARTAVFERDNVIEYLLHKVAELETNQQECSSYQIKMLLELSYIKNKLEQSERRISELEAIVYDMRPDEYTENTLEKDPVYKSTNETVTITEETNISHTPGFKRMASHKPGILRRDARGIAAKHIGFYAVIANSIGTLNHNEIVHFDTVVLNEGNGFNKQTGIFTCPLSGIYYFSVSMMTPPGYNANVNLIVNGEIKANSFAFGSNSYDQGSISCILRCEAGHNVWVGVYYDTYIHGDYYTSFSAFLIWADATGSR